MGRQSFDVLSSRVQNERRRSYRGRLLVNEFFSSNDLLTYFKMKKQSDFLSLTRVIVSYESKGKFLF